MRKKQLSLISSVLILLAMVLAACDSGSSTPTAVRIAPTTTTESRSVEQSTPAPSDAPTVVAAAPTATTAPAFNTPITKGGASDTPPVPDTSGDTGTEAEWTILMYVDADDDQLEANMMIDIMEAERAGSTNQVNILAQIDRLDGTTSGWGNWTTTKRFLIEKKQNLNDFQTISSTELDDLGEVNMADPKNLADFLTWGMKAYPAKKYAVILSDHGIGWVGCCSDHSTGGADLSEDAAGTVSKASVFGPNVLWLMNIDGALRESLSATGVEKFELVGFDQCLMSQLEVYTTLADTARYAVASEEVEPALGWAYTDFLDKLNANPEVDGAELGKAIVEAYVDSDVMLTSGRMPQSTKDDTTLSVIDLGALADVYTAFDALLGPLSSSNQEIVAESRRYAQSYESPFGKEVPSSYIDLGSFLALVDKRTESEDVKAAIAPLMDAYKRAVIAEKHGSLRPGSTGITIYFPVEAEYKIFSETYNLVAQKFAEGHQWDEYLQAHYNNTALGDAAPPPADEQPEGDPSPGDGVVQISPVELSDSVASPDAPVNVKTTIVGDKLAYLYFFVGRILADDNVLLTNRTEFIQATQTEEEGGVKYPVWPDGSFDVDFDWQPDTFALTDGTNTVGASFEAEEYDDDLPIYRVDGVYTSGSQGGESYAQLTFQGGQLLNIYAYPGDSDLGTLTQIIPTEGDTFTPTESGFDLNPDATESDVTRPSDGTLTYGPDGFSIVQSAAEDGEYVIGFIAEDLDGQVSEEYETVTVKNP